jgi:hypothetical protein
MELWKSRTDFPMCNLGETEPDLETGVSSSSALGGFLPVLRSELGPARLLRRRNPAPGSR